MWSIDTPASWMFHFGCYSGLPLGMEHSIIRVLPWSKRNLILDVTYPSVMNLNVSALDCIFTGQKEYIVSRFNKIDLAYLASSSVMETWLADTSSPPAANDASPPAAQGMQNAGLVGARSGGVPLRSITATDDSIGRSAGFSWTQSRPMWMHLSIWSLSSQHCWLLSIREGSSSSRTVPAVQCCHICGT